MKLFVVLASVLVLAAAQADDEERQQPTTIITTTTTLAPEPTTPAPRPQNSIPELRSLPTIPESSPQSTIPELRSLPTIPEPRPQPNLVPRYVSNDRNAQILRFENTIDPDGSFSYEFETDNGIAAQAQGIPRNFGGNPPVVPVVVQGAFAWRSPEGKPIAITYVADENGYRPSGDAIPTPPPIPAAIARALAYIAKNLQKKK